MKKLALGAILGASLLVSTSAFALTAMTDANMKSATGQAGVSITLDNIVIEQYVGSTTYTDGDGTSTTLSPADDIAGSIRITDKHVVKEYLGITSGSEFTSEFLAATGKDNIADWVKASALTIDVGNCAILADGLNNNATAADADGDVTAALGTMTSTITDAYTAYVGTVPVGDTPLTAAEWKASLGAATVATATVTAAQSLVAADVADDQVEAGKYLKSVGAAGNATVAGVVIGLPTIMINTTADEYSVGVGMTGAVNDGKDFIKISKGASSMMVLSSVIEIAAH